MKEVQPELSVEELIKKYTVSTSTDIKDKLTSLQAENEGLKVKHEQMRLGWIAEHKQELVWDNSRAAALLQEKNIELQKRVDELEEGYHVFYSDQDGEYVALEPKKPSCSWLAKCPKDALKGLIDLGGQ